MNDLLFLVSIPLKITFYMFNGILKLIFNGTTNQRLTIILSLVILQIDSVFFLYKGEMWMHLPIGLFPFWFLINLGRNKNND